MPKKPPPVTLEHVFSSDIEAAHEAYVRTFVHLLDFILENDALEPPAKVDARFIA
jgi:hypothetical protein